MMLKVPFLATNAVLLFVSLLGHAQSLSSDGTSPAPLSHSLRLEAETSLMMGAEALAGNQRANGSWGNSPAITSLAVMALTNAAPARQDITLARRKALAYLAACQKETGAISNARTRQYEVLTTALSVQALAQKDNEAKAQRRTAAALGYLLSQQHISGGFPAAAGQIPNLATTLFAVEAIYLCQLRQIAPAEELEGVFDQAGAFILACRAPGNDGTFANSPPSSGFKPAPPGMDASPAFLTCTGIRGLLYTGTTPTSPGLALSLAWLNDHLAFDKNPGLGQHGYYTYILGLAKTLRVCESAGVDFSPYPNLMNWRNTMARELMRRQEGPGRWKTGNSDWWENSRDIVAANVMFALGNLLL